LRERRAQKNNQADAAAGLVAMFDVDGPVAMNVAAGRL
jgi:hypothetical protein